MKLDQEKLKSKSLWVSLIMSLLAFFSGDVQAIIAANPEYTGLGASLIIGGLKVFDKKK
jgi:hypothetical protein